MLAETYSIEVYSGVGDSRHLLNVQSTRKHKKAIQWYSELISQHDKESVKFLERSGDGIWLEVSEKRLKEIELLPEPEKTYLIVGHTTLGGGDQIKRSWFFGVSPISNRTEAIIKFEELVKKYESHKRIDVQLFLGELEDHSWGDEWIEIKKDGNRWIDVPSTVSPW